MVRIREAMEVFIRSNRGGTTICSQELRPTGRPDLYEILTDSRAISGATAS